MAINYLYQWRYNRELLEPLLSRIEQFFKAGSHTLLPTAMYFLVHSALFLVFNLIQWYNPFASD